MIKIYIETDKSDFFSSEVESIPRIGDTVLVVGCKHKVYDVIHTLKSRYEDRSILVKLMVSN